MCGLVAFACKAQNGFQKNQIDAFSEMVYINALRGRDSTGVFYVTNSGTVQTHKEASDSASFLKSKEWESTTNELWSSGKVAVVHCRAATRGDKTDENAHPFVVDDRIVLVHNGTMFGDHKKFANVDVDSHAIAHVLAQENDVATALRQINGAYALIWYDIPNQTLNMIRNDHRPLWIGETQDGSIMAASEAGFIHLTALRNNIKLKDGGVSLIPEDTLVTIDTSSYQMGIKMEKLDSKFKYVASTSTNVTVLTPPEANKEEPPFPTEAANSQGVRVWPRVACAYEGGNKNQRAYKYPLDIAEDLQIGIWEPHHPNENFRNWAGEHETVYLEPFDYVCAYTGESAGGIDEYHLFGTIISNNKKINGMAACWTIQAQTEYDAVAMSTTPYLKGKIEHGIGRPVEIQKPKAKQYALWKVYAVEKVDSMPVEYVQ